MRAWWVLCAAMGGLGLARSGQAENHAAGYADVLNLHATGSAFNAFFDYGAWHGYALQAVPEQSLGFVGPLPLSESKTWEVGTFARLELSDARTGQSIRPESGSIQSHALAGRLVQAARFDGLRTD